MSVERRLNRLESRADASLPNGQLLLELYEALPDGAHRGWLTARTIAELDALLEAGRAVYGAEADGGFDWAQLTDEQLSQAMNLDDDELGRLIAGNLSLLKGRDDQASYQPC